MSKKKFMGYKLDELLCENNESLYEELTAKGIVIKLIKSKSQMWSAPSGKDLGTIEFAKCNDPQAAFTHELLHVKIESEGYVQPMVKDNENVTNILGFLFNQLAHHRMYPLFIAMEFEPSEFLNDNDEAQTQLLLSRDIPMLEKIYATHKQLLEGIPVLMPYLVLKSPNENSEKGRIFMERLRKISNPTFLAEIDLIISEWESETGYDVSLTFAKIFKACKKPRVGFCVSGLDKDIIVAGSI